VENYIEKHKNTILTLEQNTQSITCDV